MTHKEEAKLCHTIAVLISLLADYTDDLTPSGTISKEFKEKALKSHIKKRVLIPSFFKQME